ncbi:NmrA family NAD(P)-binding protein [Rhodococcus sp. BP-349]|uniref:NmrA family NAD(P)-binding protein n=1 Tax=unclassified Rhodococcus (in: high G+C Gram-positive bacteria) TaxID=192944 RepID=UPI001C9A7742|nr:MULTISPECIES: NmrA family NAD(P)-binding protein [unclassified Rhodococcus (in: high G+C Gram-positive bacteria)]MBY6537921.1 NmrA family NAD(P)-binding protein [Rhodococcus sp. BP-363]MBY6542258.1 NmrA family NAD(P)-binding protein [Rhodococcus sp. BP-369]MBY6561488.1 NmrA family NAD(P)-binding protein [Rhodococcus sp. BP-370]MBY6575780.1 NmrA family NAD(P)-binding protein [Rhodococcus sp. BP-364]MBY6585081.1 NmrA family NAD(P)-binding protein [Rhodococcus sp. BP-358]
MITVTSAAGGVGRLLVRQLARRGTSVRAVVKNADQARTTRRDGASEVVVGDLRSPQTLDTALVGATVLYHAAPTQVIDERPIIEHLITSGPSHGLQHIVFHSVIHPDLHELTHHRQKDLAEGMLLDSALPTTVLRPSHYMQNYLEVWDLLLAGVMPYPVSPDSVMGVVDVADVAGVAATIALDPAPHTGRTYDLSTVELTRHQMAAIWSTVLGHSVTAFRIPPSSLRHRTAALPALGPILVEAVRATGLHSAGHLVRGVGAAANPRGMNDWPDDAREAYRTMMAHYDRHGLPAGDLTVLPALLGREPTSYEEFARRSATERGHQVTDTRR